MRSRRSRAHSRSHAAQPLADAARDGARSFLQGPKREPAGDDGDRQFSQLSAPRGWAGTSSGPRRRGPKGRRVGARFFFRIATFYFLENKICGIRIYLPLVNGNPPWPCNPRTSSFEARLRSLLVFTPRDGGGRRLATKMRRKFSVLQPVEKSRNAIGISQRVAPRAIGAEVAGGVGSRMPRSKPEAKFSALQTLE